ncbi:MAG: two-component system OmpR family response regulator [Candidatus Azotimanducaceae bacterium]|jgi:two-component system OmpR family response regulator
MNDQVDPVSILVVEDDEFVCGLLCSVLESAGFESSSENSVQGLHSRRVQEHFDAILLDLGLPDGDGLDALRQIRDEGSNVPVVVLTSRTDVEARITALEIGADDYVQKPVDPRELLLRIQRLVKHSPGDGVPNQATTEKLTLGEWTLDLAQRSLLCSGKGDVPLTRSEFDLLAALFSAPNRVLTREHLLDALERDNDSPYDRTVDVLISRLRKKLVATSGQSSPIQTVQGVGYKLKLP